MGVHIRRWGNSAAVRLPSAALTAAGLKIDDAIDIREEDGRIVLEKSKHPKTDLKALIAGITPENRHQETDWGPPVGREIW